MGLLLVKIDIWIKTEYDVYVCNLGLSEAGDLLSTGVFIKIQRQFLTAFGFFLPKNRWLSKM